MYKTYFFVVGPSDYGFESLNHNSKTVYQTSTKSLGTTRQAFMKALSLGGPDEDFIWVFSPPRPYNCNVNFHILITLGLWDLYYFHHRYGLPVTMF